MLAWMSLAAACQAQGPVNNAQLQFNVPLGSQGKEVCAWGDYAYVGQGTAGIKVVKIRGIGAPFVAGTIRPYAGSANINIVDVEVHGNTLYAGNDLPNGAPTPHTGVFMFDLAANAITPPSVGEISSDSFPGSYYAAAVHNLCVADSGGRTMLYVASAISSTVPVYDVTNPAVPEPKDELYVLNSQYAFYGAAHDVSVKNGKLVTTLSTGGFTLHDVSNIHANYIDWQNSTIVSTATLLNHTKYAGANTWHAAFSEDGNWLVTTDGGNSIGCRTWNLNAIPGPRLPMTHTAQFTPGTGSTMHNIRVAGNFVYLSHFMDGLRILSLNPANGSLTSVGQYDPSATNSSTTNSGGFGVFVHGEQVLLSDRTQGLYSIDFVDTLSIPLAEWKRSTGTLTVEGTSTAAPSVILSVTGFGQMTWNANTGRYRLVRTGVTTQPTSVQLFSNIGGVQSAPVRRR